MAESPAPPPPAAPAAAPTSTAVVVPTTFRDRLAQFKILEEKRLELIEELLIKLESTEARLAATELDLHSEQNVRRTLQAEVVEAKERENALAQKQARRPFVLVLIDGDAEGFMFHDKYITKRAQGGEALADELLLRLREYIRPLYEDADSLDIIVRIYSNLEGMANILVREGKVRNLGQLRACSTGFSTRVASFDWVDVGVGKEGTSTRKVKENLTFFTPNTHLRHLILALNPAAMPPTLLTTLPLPLSSVSLIESATLPADLTAIPALHFVKLPTLFVSPPPSPTPRSPRMHGRGGGGAQLQLSQQDDPDGGSTWLVIRPERSKSLAGGGARGRRGRSEDDDSSLSISIGPDNTVSVDSGRRRRVMG
ncbi:hypothetical protein M011DRAFT_472151 [Sporormia fimetaria CBS 119925]|uniref:DUF7923 domain-containing protein n=1 Tax=Sporormia fimetaria CBS 119925 TaxID=1340428 RepID=A0A6A6UYU2_9PLEO|nr:hypothetical protein M011DRAFT_472151 [Sporormia fimetaria CBS 119925]